MKSRKEEKQERGFAALLSILFGKHELDNVFELSFFYPTSWFVVAVAHKLLPEEEWIAAWSVEIFKSDVDFYFFLKCLVTGLSEATLELIELLVWEREFCVCCLK